MKTKFISLLVVFTSFSAQAEILPSPCSKSGGGDSIESQELRMGRYEWAMKCLSGFSEMYSEDYWFQTHDGVTYLRGYPTFARLVDGKKEIVFAPTDATASCEGFEDIKMAGICI